MCLVDVPQAVSRTCCCRDAPHFMSKTSCHATVHRRKNEPQRTADKCSIDEACVVETRLKSSKLCHLRWKATALRAVASTNGVRSVQVFLGWWGGAALLLAHLPYASRASSYHSKFGNSQMRNSQFETALKVCLAVDPEAELPAEGSRPEEF